MSNSILSELISFFPQNKNFTIRSISIKDFSEFETSNVGLEKNLSFINSISLISKYDGFVFVEEPTGIMVSSLDEVHEKINVFGYYICNNLICRLSSSEVKNIYSFTLSSHSNYVPYKHFYYC